MKIKPIIIFILIFSNLSLFAQKEKWFDLEYRKENYPSTTHYKQYAEGANKKEAHYFAKTE